MTGKPLVHLQARDHHGTRHMTIHTSDRDLLAAWLLNAWDELAGPYSQVELVLRVWKEGE